MASSCLITLKLSWYIAVSITKGIAVRVGFPTIMFRLLLDPESSTHRSNTTAELDHKLRAHDLRTAPYLNNMITHSTWTTSETKPCVPIYLNRKSSCFICRSELEKTLKAWNRRTRCQWGPDELCLRNSRRSAYLAESDACWSCLLQIWLSIWKKARCLSFSILKPDQVDSGPNVRGSTKCSHHHTLSQRVELKDTRTQLPTANRWPPIKYSWSSIGALVSCDNNSLPLLKEKYAALQPVGPCHGTI